MHEEVEHLQHVVNDQLEQVLAKMGSGTEGLDSKLPKLPTLKTKGKTMSVEDKQKLKEMSDNFDRVQAN